MGHIRWNGGGIADGSGNPQTLRDSEGAHCCPQRQWAAQRCSLKGHITFSSQQGVRSTWAQSLHLQRAKLLLVLSASGTSANKYNSCA